ncbi:hypothetical protein [Paenibacillus dokdonensis]|uniref:hypothetical protein n=1 Tax=Paenibacillus dokdonensis TaxID=2567944 RepID=UPI003D2B3E80
MVNVGIVKISHLICLYVNLKVSFQVRSVPFILPRSKPDRYDSKWLYHSLAIAFLSKHEMPRFGRSRLRNVHVFLVDMLIPVRIGELGLESPSTLYSNIASRHLIGIAVKPFKTVRVRTALAENNRDLDLLTIPM